MRLFIKDKPKSWFRCDISLNIVLIDLDIVPAVDIRNGVQFGVVNILKPPQYLAHM